MYRIEADNQCFVKKYDAPPTVMSLAMRFELEMVILFKVSDI